MPSWGVWSPVSDTLRCWLGAPSLRWLHARIDDGTLTGWQAPSGRWWIEKTSAESLRAHILSQRLKQELTA